jgi:hypothetical protein
VRALGHAAFPGVDFATRIDLGGSGRMGAVAMDYLSPVSFRRIVLRGTRLVADLDLIAGRVAIDTGQGARVTDLSFDRNRMFLDAMADFLALAAGRPVSDVEHLPRLDRAGPVGETIALARERRQFIGQVTGDYA